MHAIWPAGGRETARTNCLRGLLVLGVAALAAACGASESTSSTTSGASGGSSSCATADSCSVSSGASSTSGACTNAGSGRTDQFSETVALTKQADGLQIGDIVPGQGAVVSKGQTLSMQYTGWLSDGTVFDSSRKAGRTPFTFGLGHGDVIKGWDEGIVGMHVGGIRRLVIPPDLAYGANPPSGLPANATLTFDVEVLCAG